MPDNIAIVGGGIGGLAAALALIRRGIDVDVYEQAPELRELGAGVQISANGSRVLHALGLAAALEKVQVEPAGKAVRLWDTGQTWKMFDLGMESVERYGSPYLTLHRGDLHDAIAQALLREKPDAIHLGHKCIGLTQTADHVELQFEGKPPVTAKLVIGADGVHSVLRGILFGTPQPQFCGITAWRGVVPMEKLPPTVSRTVATQWAGPGGHAVQYPLRAGTLLNFVGIVERSDWTVEGWNVRGTTEEFANDFRGWHADIQAIIRSVDVPYKWALALRPTMDTWSKGRCTLLGDACHPMVPFLAQGAVDGAGRCARPRALPGKISERPRHGVCALRGGAGTSRQQGGQCFGGYDSASPQSRLGRRCGSASPHRARMAGGPRQGPLRLAVHLRCDDGAGVKELQRRGRAICASVPRPKGFLR